MAQVSAKKPKRSKRRIYLTALAAAALAVLLTLGLAWATYGIIMASSADSGDSWASLGAAIITLYLTIPYLLITMLLCLKFSRTPNWPVVGTITTLVMSGAVWLYSQPLGEVVNVPVPYVFLLLAVGAGASAVCTLAAYRSLRARMATTPAAYIATAVLVGACVLGSGKLLVTVLAAIEAPGQRRATVQAQADDLHTLHTRLSELGFTVYNPKVLPKGYKLSSIVPADMSLVDNGTPHYLTFNTTAPGNAPTLTIYEVVASPNFKPELGDCGPYDATTFPYGGSSPLPCKLLLTVNSTAVYSYFASYVYPEEYGYYIQIGGTAILAVTQGGSMSDGDMRAFAGSLQPTAIGDLPQDLLQLY